MQAVVKIGSSQYLVSPGEEIVVDRLPASSPEITLDQILLIVSESQTLVGQPTVPNAAISATILANIKGKKLAVSKFKAKSRYRKTIGFRPQLTRLRINTITTEKQADQQPQKTTSKKTRVK